MILRQTDEGLQCQGKGRFIGDLNIYRINLKIIFRLSITPKKKTHIQNE